MRLMKSKIFLLLGVVFILNSCSKDDVDTYVFERGQIVSSSDIGTFTVSSMETFFDFINPELSSQINYQFDVNRYVIVYETITHDGNQTQASGLLTIPKGVNSSAPLLSFQHGTVLQQNAVPSSMAAGTGMEFGLIFGTEGYIVCIPDFLGLGQGNGLHPYMHAKSEATVTVDMLRAAKNKLNDLGVVFNDQLFLMGYSQGGHATMATHKFIESDYNDEFTVTASSPMAGPYDVSGIMADLILKKEEYIAPGFLPYMLYSYNSVYNIYSDLESNFISPYNSSLKPYFNGDNLHSLSKVNDIMPLIPSDIFTDNAYDDIITKSNSTFWNALQDNDLYDWHPVAPIRMFHCNGDITVPMSNSEKALESFQNKGVSNVELINPHDGGTHSTCIVPSAIAAKEWFNTFK